MNDCTAEINPLSSTNGGTSSRSFGKLNFLLVKKEQMDVIVGIIEQDVFVEDYPAIVIVVTPLTSIMKDQASM